MKRSTVNQTIVVAKQAFESVGFALPPFAYWTRHDGKEKGPEADEIRLCMLGWNVTDFGQRRFNEIGRTLRTLRNGWARYDSGKDYAGKLILDPEDQKPPLHFHRHKMEDIINRGGGNILVRLYKADEAGQCSAETFIMQLDGITRPVKPGDVIRLEPGQSLCIPPRTITQFWGERGTGFGSATDATWSAPRSAGCATTGTITAGWNHVSGFAVSRKMSQRSITWFMSSLWLRPTPECADQYVKRCAVHYMCFRR